MGHYVLDKKEVKGELDFFVMAKEIIKYWTRAIYTNFLGYNLICNYKKVNIQIYIPICMFITVSLGKAVK